MIDVIHDFASEKPVKSSIVLLGIKHVGKTTIGQDFASRHRMAWIDLDDMIVDHAREKYGIEACMIRDVYIQLGKKLFQDLESASARYLNINQGRNMIISTGGGVADNSAAMKELKNLGPLIYLYEEESVLFTRIINKGVPPFLDPHDPARSFHELFLRRDKVYQEQSALTVNLHGCDIQQAIEYFNRNLVSYLEKADR